MKKSKKLFLTILSIFLLSGSFGGVLANQPGIADGGGGVSVNVGRGLTSSGGGNTRPTGSASITVTRANTVRSIWAGAHITGGGDATNINSTSINNSLPNGTRAATVTLTAGRNTGVTLGGMYEYRHTGSERWNRLENLSRTW